MAKRSKGKDPGALRDGEQTAKRSGALTNPIRNLIITAVVCVLLAAAFLSAPFLVREYCGYVIGGLLCAAGVVYILIYFLRKPVSGVYRSEFAWGAVALGAGIYVIVASLRPDTTGLSITLRLIVCALGVLMAADGILKLQYTLDLARMHFSAWWVGLIVSLLGIALGVLTALGWVDAMAVRMNLIDGGFLGAMTLLGAAFAANALLDVIAVILVAVRNRKAAKAAAAEAAAAAAAAAMPVPEPAPYAPPASPYGAPASPYAPPAEPAAPAAPAEPAAPETPTVTIEN